MPTPASPDSIIRPPRPPGPPNQTNPIDSQTSQPQPLPHPQQTLHHGARPALATPTTGGLPTSVRPGEYIVLLTPNPRQPGVQGIRYPYIPLQRHAFTGAPGAPGATIIQRPALIRGVAQQGLGVHPAVIPSSQQFGIAGVSTSMASQSGSPLLQQQQQQQSIAMMSSASTAQQSQMTPNEALTKGTHFFNSLLNKMQIQSKKTNVQNLIQSLIDGKKSAEDFAKAIQKEFNSEKQPPQLVPFLELLLPHLRQSMNAGITVLPGFRPPNRQENVSMQPASSDQTHLSTSSITTSPIKDNQNSNTATIISKINSPIPSIVGTLPTSMPTPPASIAPKKKKTPLPPGQKSQYAIKKEAREARKREKELAAQNIKMETTDDKLETDQRTEKPFVKPKLDKTKRQEKQKKSEKQLESLSAALRDDDDVNDVATMGGVNLAEESQKIMASGAELVGTQIRSCKDEPFFDLKSLSIKVARIVKKHNLPEPSSDVITLISHATQERLKDFVERLGVLAEHRAENLKLNPKYEVTSDIKWQMKFLAELDRIEKRRYEEQERELLLRVAKSRSKVEDPEQQKLRQKAKDMQRAEQEEVRQREANQTALLAIGPRKKMKTSGPPSMSSFSQSSAFRETKMSDARTDNIRRIKRVNMRDLQVLLELDRTHLDRLVKISAQ